MGCSFQFAIEEVGQTGVEVQTGFTAIDAVVAVGVELHLKGFVELHQRFGILRTVLEVNVVISQTVYKQQTAV